MVKQIIEKQISQKITPESNLAIIVEEAYTSMSKSDRLELVIGVGLPKATLSVNPKVVIKEAVRALTKELEDQKTADKELEEKAAVRKSIRQVKPPLRQLRMHEGRNTSRVQEAIANLPPSRLAEANRRQDSREALRAKRMGEERVPRSKQEPRGGRLSESRPITRHPSVRPSSQRAIQENEPRGLVRNSRDRDAVVSPRRSASFPAYETSTPKRSIQENRQRPISQYTSRSEQGRPVGRNRIQESGGLRNGPGASSPKDRGDSPRVKPSSSLVEQVKNVNTDLNNLLINLTRSVRTQQTRIQEGRVKLYQHPRLREDEMTAEDMVVDQVTDIANTAGLDLNQAELFLDNINQLVDSIKNILGIANVEDALLTPDGMTTPDETPAGTPPLLEKRIEQGKRKLRAFRENQSAPSTYRQGRRRLKESDISAAHHQSLKSITANIARGALERTGDNPGLNIYQPKVTQETGGLINQGLNNPLIKKPKSAIGKPFTASPSTGPIGKSTIKPLKDPAVALTEAERHQQVLRLLNTIPEDTQKKRPLDMYKILENARNASV